MAEPSKERIAAALALAEAAERYWPDPKGSEGPLAAAIVAYQRTTAELRTRAEVDADIARRCRQRARELEGMFHVVQGSTCSRDIHALCDEPTAPDAGPAQEPVRVAFGNPLARIQWQCSSCGWGYFGPSQDACPGCGAEGYWSDRVAPDCKPWPGYPCAPGPGVMVAPLPPPERKKLLEEIAAGVVDMLDGEPSGSDSLDWALERYGYKPTKGVPAEPEGEEDAQAESTGKICVVCGKQVEAERECYVIPHCLQCLPATAPLAEVGSTSELVRALQEGNKFLQDQLVAANAARRLRLAEIYHLTITYTDPATALLAIRNACGPGA